MRTKEHNEKIGLANRGKPKSEEHKKNISLSAKKRLSIPENNPNYKGDRVGYVGIHVWLRKTFGYPDVCESCNKVGQKINGRWNLVYAKIEGALYARNRSNFKKLCNKCHRNYDSTKEWNKNISKGKTGKKRII